MSIMQISSAVAQAPIARRAALRLQKEWRNASDYPSLVDTALQLATQLRKQGLSHEACGVLSRTDRRLGVLSRGVRTLGFHYPQPNPRGEVPEGAREQVRVHLEIVTRSLESARLIVVHPSHSDPGKRTAEELAHQAMACFSIGEVNAAVWALECSVSADVMAHIPESLQREWRAEARATIARLGTWQEVLDGNADLNMVIKQWHSHLNHPTAR